MRVIDESTVELTDSEYDASAYFRRHLDEGMNIPDAVARTKDAFWMYVDDEKFWEWLAT